MAIKSTLLHHPSQSTSGTITYPHGLYTSHSSQGGHRPNIQSKGKRGDSPLQSPKNNRRGHDITDIAPTQEQILFIHRQRDPAREPEYHGHEIEPQDGVFVRYGGEEAGCEREVDECEEGPEGDEYEEVDAGGRVLVEGVGVIPMRGWEGRVSSCR